MLLSNRSKACIHIEEMGPFVKRMQSTSIPLMEVVAWPATQWLAGLFAPVHCMHLGIPKALLSRNISGHVTMVLRPLLLSALQDLLLVADPSVVHSGASLLCCSSSRPN